MAWVDMHGGWRILLQVMQYCAGCLREVFEMGRFACCCEVHKGHKSGYDAVTLPLPLLRAGRCKGRGR